MRLIRAVVLVLPLLLTACPQGDSGEDAGRPPGGQAVDIERLIVAGGGVLRLPLEIDPAGLAGQSADPGGPETLPASYDTADPRLFALARCIEVPLVRCSAAGHVSPGLAATAEHDQAGQVWTFTLPPEGAPLEDAVGLYSALLERWEAILKGPRTPLQAQLADLLEGAADFRDGRALKISGLTFEESRLTVRLTRPNLLFARWVSQPGLGAAGLGPFVVDRWEGNELVLTPNPDSLVGTPLLDEIRFVCEPDRSRQLELFREGRLDAANVRVEDAELVRADPVLAASVHEHRTASPILGFFDLHEFPWGDSQFQDKLGLRQAVNWALDREFLGETLSGQLAPWPHFLPEPMSASIPPERIQQPPYPLSQEIELARDGLKRADHEQGSHLIPGMDLGYLNYQHLEREAAEILGYLDEVSVKMRPFPMTYSELASRVSGGTHEIILARCYPAYPAPDALFYPLLYSANRDLGGNWSLLNDLQVDALIERCQAALDETTRLKNERDLSAYLEDLALCLFVGYATPTLLLNPGLGGYALTPYDFDASLPAQDFTKLGWTLAAGQTEATAPQEE